jgi:hypothetical protein
VDATGGVFHREQQVQPLWQQRLDAEEVGGENAAGLPAQELPPAGPVAAKGGINAGSLQDRPHGTRRDLVAKPGEFAVDAPSMTTLLPSPYTTEPFRSVRHSLLGRYDSLFG